MQEPQTASCGKATRPVDEVLGGECGSTTLGCSASLAQGPGRGSSLLWEAQQTEDQVLSDRHGRGRDCLSPVLLGGHPAPIPSSTRSPVGWDREAPVKVTWASHSFPTLHLHTRGAPAERAPRHGLRGAAPQEPRVGRGTLWALEELAASVTTAAAASDTLVLPGLT